jgi:hypothetical protein
MDLNSTELAGQVIGEHDEEFYEDFSNPKPAEQWVNLQTQDEATGINGPSMHISYVPINRVSVSRSQFLPYMTWSKPEMTVSQQQMLDTWTPSLTARLEVKIGTGSGQIAAPFSITRLHFDDLCQEYQFCPAFLGKVIRKASFFEHHFGGGHATLEGSSAPTHLEMALAVYEIDAFMCLLRYDIGNMAPKSVRCLLFVKRSDPRKLPLPVLHNIRSWFGNHRELLERYPLLVVNVILSFMQARAHEYVRGRQGLNDIEARLGVTHHLSRLRRSGYADVSYDFEALNADLAGLSKRVANNELSATTILEHAKALQRIVQICEALEKPSRLSKDTAWLSQTSEQQEEIQSTIIRAELYLKHTKMMQDAVQSLTAALYNRISKNDTRSMKTIAVVTLFILPSTLVSSIFSTGIFNFHAGESTTDPKVVSDYGWIYLVTCVVLTLFTLAAWVCWYIWGNVWLDKFRRSRRKRSS